ncbi:MAG: hypothetical protein R3F43_03770 [bacterium]
MDAPLRLDHFHSPALAAWRAAGGLPSSCGRSAASSPTGPTSWAPTRRSP